MSDSGFVHSGMFDLTDETWGTGPLEEYNGKTAAQMREELRRMARTSQIKPVKFTYGPQTGIEGEAVTDQPVRFRVEETQPGLFRFIAIDVDPDKEQP